MVAGGQAGSGTGSDFALARHNVDGSLDTSFGTGGQVTTPIGVFDDRAQALTLQADGKLVAAGSSHNGSDHDFALVRYNTDGFLDASFGAGGKVTTPIGMFDDEASALTLQGDGKLVAAGYVWSGTNEDFALVRYNPDGSLDSSFGTGGKVTTPIGAGSAVAFALVVQGDGKLVVAGYACDGDCDFALVRYNPDGSLDNGFGTGGVVTTAIGGAHDVARALTLQADGKLVAAGYSSNGSGSDHDFALVRYNTDGSLDASFGAGGKVTTPVGTPGTANEAAYALVLQADGKLVAAGSSSNGSGTDFALVRYNSDGSLDTSFGIAGKAATVIGKASALALQADGKLVAAGSGSNGANNDSALVRYNTDGSLDTSFGPGGPVALGLEAGPNVLQRQADGKLVAAGHVWNGVNDGFALVRYNADGSRDTSFGTLGKVTTTVGTFHDYPHALVVQADGKLVAAGSAWNDSNRAFALVRYNADGSLDTSFGTGGKVTTPFGAASTDEAYALVLQADGKLVAAGNTWDGSNRDFALVRYHPHGSLDTSFGIGGKVTTPIGAFDDGARALILQADGKLVAAGYSANGGDYDFALVRYNADGSLDASFGTGGKVTTTIGVASHDEAYTLALQDDGKLVATGYSTDSDVILVRYNTDGSLDASFGTGGKVATPIGTSADQANALAIQADGKLMAAGYSWNGNTYDFGLVRYNTDGSVDGIWTGDANHPVPALSLVVDPDGNLVAMSGNLLVRYLAPSQPATHFSVSLPANAPVGVPVLATVIAVDASNNMAFGYSGTVHFTSTDGSAVLPADVTLTGGAGTFPVTFNTVGIQAVTAIDTVTSAIAGTSGDVSVSVSTATHFALTAPAMAVPGTAFNVTVTALDALNNIFTSYSGTVHFTSSDGAAVLPADATLTNATGTFQVTLATAGTQTVTATDTVNSDVNGSGNFSVSAGAATHFNVTAPATAAADAIVTVTVTALDAFDNTVTAYSGIVHFTSSDGAAVLPADSALTNGTGTFPVMFKTAGAQMVAATDTVTSSITGTSGAIDVATVAVPLLASWTLGALGASLFGLGVGRLRRKAV